MDGDETNEYLSTLYHVLRARRRRQTIWFLSESNDFAVTVRLLGRQIAAAEQNLPPTQATGEPYRNVYNALSQTHLPTLADAGVVIYDPKRQRVSPGENFMMAALLILINRPVVRTLYRPPMKVSFDNFDSRSE